DSVTSPLTPIDRHMFTGLNFFAPDSTYAVKAKLVRSTNEKPFAMPTTTSRKPMYIKFGVLHFEITGRQFQLNVYQNVDRPRNPLYKDYLFLPFTDLTSGVESYGGGRYLDLKIPPDDILILDFNRAYNPYCAYNPKYSCPIVPAENDLQIKIRAGAKKFKE
ncbi:MAG: DUF1684 domain-containing protein, partial [Flavobacterium sp.]|nr:DUF1684 domain-containing protein [Flavobacterium sp.]